MSIERGDGWTEGLLLLAGFPAMGGILVGPLMLFLPVFLFLESWSVWAVVTAAPFESHPWATTPVIWVGGVAVTYLSFRIFIALDRGVECGGDDLSDGIRKAYEEGEVAGAIHLLKVLTSYRVAREALFPISVRAFWAIASLVLFVILCASVVLVSNVVKLGESSQGLALLLAAVISIWHYLIRMRDFDRPSRRST